MLFDNISHVKEEKYDNLMKEGDCEMSYTNRYNDKTREFIPCKYTIYTFKEKGFINE